MWGTIEENPIPNLWRTIARLYQLDCTVNVSAKWNRSSWSKASGKGRCLDCGNNCDRRAERCRSCWNVIGTGEKSSNYRGGRYIDQNGYVRVLNPDPNRAHKNRYVAEHRLVMEQHLNRKLLRSENVHHKNGIRDDNRLENLELWVTYQPSGQRIPDLLEWAYEIIQRYGTEDR